MKDQKEIEEHFWKEVKSAKQEDNSAFQTIPEPQGKLESALVKQAEEQKSQVIEKYSFDWFISSFSNYTPHLLLLTSLITALWWYYSRKRPPVKDTRELVQRIPRKIAYDKFLPKKAEEPSYGFLSSVWNNLRDFFKLGFSYNYGARQL